VEGRFNRSLNHVVIAKVRKMTDGMQESLVEGATGSESGPGWWTAGEEVFGMEG